MDHPQNLPPMTARDRIAQAILFGSILVGAFLFGLLILAANGADVRLPDLSGLWAALRFIGMGLALFAALVLCIGFVSFVRRRTVPGATTTDWLDEDFEATPVARPARIVEKIVEKPVVDPVVMAELETLRRYKADTERVLRECVVTSVKALAQEWRAETSGHINAVREVERLQTQVSELTPYQQKWRVEQERAKRFETLLGEARADENRMADTLANANETIRELRNQLHARPAYTLFSDTDLDQWLASLNISEKDKLHPRWQKRIRQRLNGASAAVVWLGEPERPNAPDPRTRPAPLPRPRAARSMVTTEKNTAHGTGKRAGERKVVSRSGRASGSGVARSGRTRVASGRRKGVTRRA